MVDRNKLTNQIDTTWPTWVRLFSDQQRPRSSTLQLTLLILLFVAFTIWDEGILDASSLRDMNMVTGEVVFIVFVLIHRCLLIKANGWIQRCSSWKKEYSMRYTGYLIIFFFMIICTVIIKNNFTSM